MAGSSREDADRQPDRVRQPDRRPPDRARGGFELPEAKGGVDWIDPDTLLLSSAFGGPDMATDSGYARSIRLWRRGADLTQLPILFETTRTAMGVWGWVDRLDRTRLWYAERPGFFDQRLWLGDIAGTRTRIDLPEDVEIAIEGDWLAVKRRSDWTIGERIWPADTLLGISLAAYRAGDRGFAALFEPGPRRALESFFWNRGTLIVESLDELLPVVERHVPAASTAWRRERLAQLPAQGVVDVGRLDVEADAGAGELLVTAQDPLTPPTLMLLADALAAPEILKRSSAVFDARGLVVTQHQATGVDGERIPYTQVGPATGERRRAGASHRLWRLRHRDAGRLRIGDRQAVARARRHACHRQHPRRRRVRHALARGGTARAQVPRA
jgi:prolyl oligopeptidase